MNPIFIENFLPKDILNLTHSYCILKYINQKKFNIDFQSNSLIKEYSESLMETILDMSTTVISQNLGKALVPTYSYLRIYDKGSDLPIHKDRESCEYTVALCLGCDPVSKPYEIFIGEEDFSSRYSYLDGKGEYKKMNIEHSFLMSPNNALIFSGIDKFHWREVCDHDYYITAFLHYVEEKGKYSEYKFDKRNMLGEKND